MAEYSPSKIIKDGNTYNFRDTTKIPLSGSNAISGSLIPSTNETVDLGGPSYQWNNAYIKSLTINGVACGDILTHNASEFVPRSGGAVMTGDFLGKNNSTGELNISGGTSFSDGSRITLSGINKGNTYAGAITLATKPVNASDPTKYMDLFPNGTWTWNGTACVISSDYRLKDEINSISDEVLDAWERLEPKQYKYKSDLENDKENAQVHYGWIAQDVESVIKGNRKGSVKNGLWLHEEWGEQAEVSHEETYTEEVATKSGEKQTVTKTRKVIDTPYKAKGDSYGLRYTECLVVECAYLRKKNKELQEQLDKLSARLDKLESASSK